MPSSYGSDAENDKNQLVIFFEKNKHGEQLGNISADIATEKYFIVKWIVLETVEGNLQKIKFFLGLEHKTVNTEHLWPGKDKLTGKRMKTIAIKDMHFFSEVFLYNYIKLLASSLL